MLQLNCSEAIWSSVTEESSVSIIEYIDDVLQGKVHIEV